MTVASRDLTKDLLVLKNKAMNSQFGKQRRFRSTVVTGTPFSIPLPPHPPQKNKNQKRKQKNAHPSYNLKNMHSLLSCIVAAFLSTFSVSVTHF